MDNVVQFPTKGRQDNVQRLRTELDQKYQEIVTRNSQLNALERQFDKMHDVILDLEDEYNAMVHALEVIMGPGQVPIKYKKIERNVEMCFEPDPDVA